MTRQPILLNPFNGVGAGQRATLQIARGQRIFKLIGEYDESGGPATEANMITDLTRIAVVVGNKEQRVMSAAQLFMLNKFVGKAVRTGYFTIPFAEDDRRTMQGEDVLAWGTANLPETAIEVRVDVVAGATTPVLRMRAEVDDVPLPLGDIVKIREATIDVGAAGDITWKPDIGRGERIRRIHINDGGNLDAIELKVDRKLEYEVDSAYNVERLTEAGFVPQANWTHIAFDVTKRVLDNLDIIRTGADGQPYAVQTVAAKLTFSGTGNFPVLIEYVGPRD